MGYPQTAAEAVQRQPRIIQCLDDMEKSIQEARNQWERCSNKIACVVTPYPCSPPDKQAEPDNSVKLADRIEMLTRMVNMLTSDICETTNQIEL